MKKKRNSPKQAKNTGKFYVDPLVGSKVASDRVYSDSSELYRGSDEWEFGANAIVHTYEVYLNSADPADQDSIGRDVLIGNFKYSKTGEISGSIEYWVNGDFLPERGIEHVGVTRINGVNTFRNYRESQAILLRENGVDVPFYYEKFVSPQDIASDAVTGINTVTDKSGLAAYGASSFFAGEWWTNPFAPNLI